MNFYLLKMKVNGIKSIDKSITLSFYNKNYKKTLKTEQSHVKAIYGPNGAGKTGLIYAVEIYKNVIKNKDYIVLANSNKSLSNLINQKLNKFEIEMTYAVLNGQNIICVLEHYISIKKSEDGFVINEEKLSIVADNNPNNSKKVLFYVIDGKIAELHDSCKNKEDIYKVTTNLLDKQSFINIVCQYYLKNKNKIEESEEFSYKLLLSLLFSYNITVFLQKSDTNYIDVDSLYMQVNDLQKEQKAIGNKHIFYQLLKENKIIKSNADRIAKNDYEDYEKLIKNLSKFIKVFKNDLDYIEIKKEEDGDYYECDNIMVYKDGKRINKKQESAGIKKIIELYSALCDVDGGKIVFIDEFDANIHDVLLVKIVEYIIQYAEGQFVFTTHNLGPMDVLQNYKYAIDFLSSDSRLISWKRNGNYSAASQYSKGFIEYSPFNIEPFSFLGVFGEE